MTPTNPFRKSSRTSGQHGTVRSYALGFILSLALTVEAYLVVVNRAFSDTAIITILLGLALLQLLVQVFFFLHFDRFKKTSWNILMFLFMLLVVAIVVVGSLWIMQNLDYNMHQHQMTPEQTDKYIQEEERITR